MKIAVYHFTARIFLVLKTVSLLCFYKKHLWFEIIRYKKHQQWMYILVDSKSCFSRRFACKCWLRSRKPWVFVFVQSISIFVNCKCNITCCKAEQLQIYLSAVHECSIMNVGSTLSSHIFLCKVTCNLNIMHFKTGLLRI